MPKSSSNRARQPQVLFGFALLFLTIPLYRSSAYAALWTTPCILLASLFITWGAESAQFFVAQGFALAILAWMQTLPEFAVEAVLAWRQQTALLLANLTGAVRLLTGLAWPIIYATAAAVHRKRTGKPLGAIQLGIHQSVEVAGLFCPVIYAFAIWWRAALNLYDAVILIGFYAGYLLLLSKLPPEKHERADDLETVPRNIVKARRPLRFFAISACFLTGGVLIYFTAEPFLESLIALAGAMRIPSFVIIQWLAPVISEFPELASAFYFARQKESASIALMNIVSSNINQWTLLAAMLPIVFSLSRGAPSAVLLDRQQQAELLLTIGQSLVGMFFLINMEFAWWEALAMFLLFAAQFVLPLFLGAQARIWITGAFFLWAVAAFGSILLSRKQPNAFRMFIQTWRAHLRN